MLKNVQSNTITCLFVMIIVSSSLLQEHLLFHTKYRKLPLCIHCLYLKLNAFSRHLKERCWISPELITAANTNKGCRPFTRRILSHLCGLYGNATTSNRTVYESPNVKTLISGNGEAVTAHWNAK